MRRSGILRHAMRDHDRNSRLRKGPKMDVGGSDRTSSATVLGGWAARRALLSGDRIALIDGENRITYTEFDRRTDQLARAFREMGVRQGDRVAALMVNSAALLETMFAAAKLGAVFVPIN